jgi:3-dehydroquinate synthase
VPERISEVVRAAGLPTALPMAMDPAAILAATRQDKKARSGTARYALPAAIGRMAGAEQGYGIPVEEAAVLQTLTEM